MQSEAGEGALLPDGGSSRGEHPLAASENLPTPDCDLISLIEVFKQFSCLWGFDEA